MATFDLGNVPSPIAQAARLAQLRELQNPNLALERQIQQAIELQRIQQQSPENQLALQIKQAQLAQIPLEAERQNLLTEQIRRELDPVYQAEQDARKLAFDVNRATQIANATSKGQKGFFDVNSGRWIVEGADGLPVAYQIPLAESLVQSTQIPSASDIPSVDPTLFSGAPTTSIIPSTPTARTLAGTIDQRSKTAEEAKKEEQAFRENLQQKAQTFTAEQNKLQREYLQGKEASKPAKQPPAKIQDQYMGAQNLFKTAPRFKQKIDELRKKGIAEPTSAEKAVINAAYQDPKGLVSGFITAVATGKIRPEIAEVEQLRAEIESNYTTSKAGLSQTASEVKRTIPVAPSRFDSWDRMLSKIKNLEEISGIYTKNVNRQYPGFAKEAGLSNEILDFATEADIPVNLPVGTQITVGGRPAVIE